MKAKKNIIGILSGIGLIALGVWLLSLALKGTEDKAGLFLLLLYGGISLIMGVYMFFNLKKEDQIEQVKEAKR